MAMESDGIEEGIEGATRVAVTIAARTAAELAREFERRARERRDEAMHEAAQDRSREQALWDQTRAQLSPVMEDRWWDQATPESIAQAYQQARAFDGRDEARPFAERIQDQVRDRYGVDVDELRAQAQKDAAEQHTEADKDRAEASRLMAEADRAENHEPTRAEVSRWLNENHPDMALAHSMELEGSDDPIARRQMETRLYDEGRRMMEAEQAPAADREDQVSQEANDRASTMYDSAERREALASELKEKGIDPEAVEARVTADAGQAAPANEAAHAPGRTPKVRKARGKGRGQRSREAQRG